MLFLPGRITGSLLVLYGLGILWESLGSLFCCVKCLETRGTVVGRSLHGMSLVVVVFLVEELILYAELLGVTGLRVETL